jgi:hypothetical protein
VWDSGWCARVTERSRLWPGQTSANLPKISPPRGMRLHVIDDVARTLAGRASGSWARLKLLELLTSGVVAVNLGFGDGWHYCQSHHQRTKKRFQSLTSVGSFVTRGPSVPPVVATGGSVISGQNLLVRSSYTFVKAHFGSSDACPAVCHFMNPT